MKRQLLVFALAISSYSIAQTQQSNEPLTITQQAEFPGGDSAFTKEFMKMLHGYIDLETYKVNGVFSFVFTIDKKGKISNLAIHPKVKNSEMFIEDMQFAMRKVKQKWKPAMAQNTPVESRYILKINFDRNDYDHDD